MHTGVSPYKCMWIMLSPRLLKCLLNNQTPQHLNSNYWSETGTEGGRGRKEEGAGKHGERGGESEGETKTRREWEREREKGERE